MALTPGSIQVLTRRLPQEKIKSRPGKGGMEFSYISPDFVIEMLNEAFGHDWDTKIVYSERHDNTAVVGLELSVRDTNGTRVSKQQFGCCEVSRGMGVGEAFKGAASDAMKKCATLLGLGLELYQADEAPAGPAPAPRFTPPVRRGYNPPPAEGQKPPPPPPPPAPAQQSAAPATQQTAPAPPTKPQAPFTPPAPAAPQASQGFGNEPLGGQPVARPAVPASPGTPAVPPKPQRNPFENSNASSTGQGPSSIQMNSLMNLAEKRGFAASDLIALAGIVDDFGQPIRSFEELNSNQAIRVIQAAQR